MRPFNFLLFGIMATVLALPGIVRADEVRKRIQYGWSAFEGAGYWAVFDDDEVVYFGYSGGAKPELPAWRWTDADHREGEAHYHVPGAYARAVAVAQAARKDPKLKPPPAHEPNCLDAGYDYFWLIPDSKKPTLEVDGCYDSGTKRERSFYQRVQQLQAALDDALSFKPSPSE